MWTIFWSFKRFWVFSALLLTTFDLFLFWFRLFTCTVWSLLHTLLRIRLKLDVQGQGGGKILDVNGQRVRVLKIRQFSWTSYVYRTFRVISYIHATTQIEQAVNYVMKSWASIGSVLSFYAQQTKNIAILFLPSDRVFEIGQLQLTIWNYDVLFDTRANFNRNLA